VLRQHGDTSFSLCRARRFDCSESKSFTAGEGLQRATLHHTEAWAAIHGVPEVSQHAATCPGQDAPEAVWLLGAHHVVQPADVLLEDPLIQKAALRAWLCGGSDAASTARG
jgi:hypothetical protein